MRRVRHLVLAAPLFFSLPFPAPALPDSMAPDVADAGDAWAVTYLMNTLFTAEFYSVAAIDPADADLNRLWERAGFALRAADAKGQRLLFAEQARPLWVKRGTERAGEDPLWKQALAGESQIFAQLVDKSFSEAGTTSWQVLKNSYQAPSPKCAFTAKTVAAIAEHQRSILEKKRAASDKDLLGPLRGWDQQKVRCLIFAMTAANSVLQNEGGFDALPLLQALRRNDPQFHNDISLNLILAVRFMHAGQFAETLRILYDLQNQKQEFRLAYDLVQRIYSFRQKGQGKVALQGL